MGKKPEMSRKAQEHHLSGQQRELIVKLISLRRTLTTETPHEILDHIKREYELELTKGRDVENPGQFLSKLRPDSPVINGGLKEEVMRNWEKMIERERQFVWKEIGFGTTIFDSWKFDFGSAKLLIDDICDINNPAEYCLFLNTQLDLNHFFLPEIQLHLALQKSIEQRLNFSAMSRCLNDTNNSKALIKGCRENRPVFKNFRLLFFPETRVELESLGDQFQAHLALVCSIHHALSIQLGILTVEHLSNLLSTRKQKIEPLDLTQLGLKNNIKSITHNPTRINSLKEDLLTNADKKQKANLNMLDYLYVKKREGYSIWSGVLNDPDKGLTYKKLKNDDQGTVVKQEFAKLLYELTVSSNSCEEHTHSGSQDENNQQTHDYLDPYHSLFFNQSQQSTFLDLYSPHSYIHPSYISSNPPNV
jgi:hypothetical protein